MRPRPNRGAAANFFCPITEKTWTAGAVPVPFSFRRDRKGRVGILPFRVGRFGV